VDVNVRGKYYGWRFKMLGITTVVTMFLSGLMLHQMKNVNPYYGFSLLFGSALFAKLISWAFLQKVDEPPLAFDYRNHYFSFFQFIRQIRTSNFAKFVVFIRISAPYYVTIVF
jgi:hypothetical protein